jgi:SPP1 family predicted phage head-tail adaptor
VSRIGAMNEIVELLRQSVVSDGLGGEARSFVPAGKMAAEVLPSRRGDAEPLADGLSPMQGWKLRVNFRRDVSIDDRIRWRGTVMRVLAAADEEGRRRYLTIYTDTGVVTD